jgi:hypothetical protein
MSILIRLLKALAKALPSSRVQCMSEVSIQALQSHGVFGRMKIESPKGSPMRAFVSTSRGILELIANQGPLQSCLLPCLAGE